MSQKVPDLKMPNQQPVNTIQSTNNQNNSALQIQYPQIKPDELSKVLDDVNTMKSRQKVVDDSIFNMKKYNLHTKQCQFYIETLLNYKEI